MKSGLITLLAAVFLMGTCVFAAPGGSDESNGETPIPVVTIETQPISVEIKGKTHEVTFEASAVEVSNADDLVKAENWAKAEIEKDQKLNPDVKIASTILRRGEADKDEVSLPEVSERVLPGVKPGIASLGESELKGKFPAPTGLKKLFHKDTGTIVLTLVRMNIVGIPMAIGMYTAGAAALKLAPNISLLNLSITTGITCSFLSGGLMFWGEDYRNWIRKSTGIFAQYFKWFWTEAAYMAVLNASTYIFSGYYDFSSVLLSTFKGLLTQGFYDVGNSFHEDYSLRKFYLGGKSVDFEKIEKNLATERFKSHQDYYKAKSRIHFYANARALVVSGFAMFGLVLNMHGIPLGTYTLAGMFATGVPYWLYFKAKQKEMQKMMGGIRLDFCEAKFVDKHDRLSPKYIKKLLNELDTAMAPQLAM